MTERERLIELIRKGIDEHSASTNRQAFDRYLADHLLANGVIVPPCKVGDTVYTYGARRVKPWKICFLGVNSSGEYKFHLADEGYKHMIEAWNYDLGKSVFLTKEEAERELKALKEREDK